MALLLVAWSSCCGCVTKRLWDDIEFNEPSPDPHLQLYYSEARKDILVVYDEVREPSAKIRRRAYFLNDSAKHGKPAFVAVAATNELKRIPIVVRTNAAQSATNAFIAIQQSPTTFTLKGDEKEIYDLPVYPSGIHQGTQIALTPAAVLADTVIVGSVVGIIVLIIWKGHPYTIDPSTFY